MWKHTVCVFIYMFVCTSDTSSACSRVTYKTKALQQALQAMGTFVSRLMATQSTILASLCIPVRQRSRIHH